MKTHCNYVLSFSDGSIKVGVTSRLETRVAEHCRSKRQAAKIVRGAYTPACDKEEAFQIEAKLCSLLAYRAADGAREWFSGEPGEFDFFRQTTGMFWQEVCNKGRNQELFYGEVIA